MSHPAYDTDEFWLNAGVTADDIAIVRVLRTDPRRLVTVERIWDPVTGDDEKCVWRCEPCQMVSETGYGIGDAVKLEARAVAHVRERHDGTVPTR